MSINNKQLKLYRVNWSKVRKVLFERGIVKTSIEAEEYRHKLHIQALGYDCSSTRFTQDELDKVLALFWTFIQPADLNAQLRQIDQPFTRFKHLALKLIRSTGEVAAHGVESYFESICLRVGKNTPEQLTKTQRSKVIAALNYHVKRSKKRHASS